MQILEQEEQRHYLLEYRIVTTKIKGVNFNAPNLFLLFAFCKNFQRSVKNCRIIQKYTTAIGTWLNMKTYS